MSFFDTGVFIVAIVALVLCLLYVMGVNRRLRDELGMRRWLDGMPVSPRSRQHPETGGSGKPAKPPKR